MDKNMETLEAIRKKIDELDNKLLEILELRFSLAIKTQKFKDGVIDKNREKEVLEKLLNKTKSFKYMDANFINKLYGLIFNFAKKLQK